MTLLRKIQSRAEQLLIAFKHGGFPEGEIFEDGVKEMCEWVQELPASLEELQGPTYLVVYLTHTLVSFEGDEPREALVTYACTNAEMALVKIRSFIKRGGAQDHVRCFRASTGINPRHIFYKAHFGDTQEGQD